MFKPRRASGLRESDPCYNLLSEILFVQADKVRFYIGKILEFQSLERDSVCSSTALLESLNRVLEVSIS